MPNIEVPNKKKVTPKFSYTCDKNVTHPVPKDIIADLRKRSLKYTKKE